MIYQILGWPRSRTAWLSNYFTVNKSICFHEGVWDFSKRKLLTPEEYFNNIKIFEGMYKYVGDANTVALNNQQYIVPDAKIVIIERDPKEITKSVKAFLGHDYTPPEIYEYPYNEFIKIKFEDIDIKLKYIWDFLMPNEPFDNLRTSILQRMNIQVNKFYLDK